MLRRLFIVVLLVAGCALAYLRVVRRVVPHYGEVSTGSLWGAFHIHSQASHDCELALDEIVTAARTLGMGFVVVTDHDVQLAAPIEIQDVIVISAAELRTPFGHLIQLGASDVLAKNLRGDLNIHDHVARLGGVSIIAHPTDTKRPWHGPIAGTGAIEIANFASSARRRGGGIFLGLLPAMAIWRVRPDLAMAQIYDRDQGALRRWDGESDPRLAGLCASDTHGLIDLASNLAAWQIHLDDIGDEKRRDGHETADGDAEPPPPSPRSADAIAARAAAIVRAIGDGRFYCAAGVAGPRPPFEFFAASTGETRLGSGGVALVEAVRELVVQGPGFSAGEATVVLLRNGEEVVRSRGSSLRYARPTAGTYRAEIRIALPDVLFGERQVPVIYSNRLRLLDPGSPGMAGVH